MNLEKSKAARHIFAERLYDNLKDMIKKQPLGLADDSREAFLELNVGLLS